MIDWTRLKISFLLKGQLLYRLDEGAREKDEEKLNDTRAFPIAYTVLGGRDYTVSVRHK